MFLQFGDDKQMLISHLLLVKRYSVACNVEVSLSWSDFPAISSFTLREIPPPPCTSSSVALPASITSFDT